MVPDYSSRQFPTQPQRSTCTGWPVYSSAHIVSTANSSRRTACTFRCFLSAVCRIGSFAPHARLPRSCGAEPFEVSFDRTASFRGRSGNHPFVLIGEDGLCRLKSFRQMLGAALTRRGLRRAAHTNFTPHVTLLYDARHVDEHPIQPIFWTVTEFVLIHSMKGHDYLARWPLQA
ncbi:2'-5' RNA ligase family protein [Bradyrhizobium sp. RDT10]